MDATGIKKYKIYCAEFKLTGKRCSKKEALLDLFNQVCAIFGTAEGIKKINSWQMQNEEGYEEIMNELKKRL